MAWKQFTGLIGWLLTGMMGICQSVPTQLNQQVERVVRDPTMKHALLSVSVLDASTGKAIYQYQEQVGLAPASTLKLLTAITSLALLGPDFKFETSIGYTGEIIAGRLNGDLVLKGMGDPTLGSWRYTATGEELLFGKWIALLREKGIKSISGKIWSDETGWEAERTPDGWIWQDIGNYYGAGAGGINWRENQFDVLLAAGSSVGAPVQIIGTKPEMTGLLLKSVVKTGAKGSGDNAYIYLPPGASEGIIRGTIPIGESPFSIAGALPDPGKQLAETFRKKLMDAGIPVSALTTESGPQTWKSVGKTFSPAMDSIVYWFLRKSINLYGEAMVKQLAFKAGLETSTSNGVDQMIRFWKDKGIEPAALQLMDGSGLSPQNRITADALTTALYWSARQPWFNELYAGLPVYNGMKLKSGSINGARAFAGFHTAANGKKYVVAILVNNYSGSGTAAVKKLYSVLDVLK